MRPLLLCLLLLGFVGSPVAGYSFLGIFPAFSPSHYIFESAVMRSLAEAGHNVTVIAPFPLAKPVPNYREILVTGIREAMNEMGFIRAADFNDLSAIGTARMFQRIGTLISNFTLKHPVTREFLARTDEHFDAVVVELNMFDAIIGFGQHFHAPVIGLATTGATIWSADPVGTPSPLSYVPNIFLPFTDRMTFVQRLRNVVLSGAEAVTYRWQMRESADLYDEVFAGDVNRPSFDAIYTNVSLVLLNQHFTLNYPRPYVPNMIEVGGIHVNWNAPRELPAEIREFMDGAEHGVIYFSLGSNVLSSQLPAEVRDGLLRVFGDLKERVLWKWEDDELPGRPANVLIRKWFPQDDVLAHPRVKLFITHGGLLSTTEAIYHGVPVVGVPVFYDQFMNMQLAANMGWGVPIEFRNLTESSLRWALDEVLDNAKFRDNAQAISRRYRDQPMDPQQTAVYWVEYVVRHAGAAHMRSAGLDLPAVQYHNVDVFAALALIAAVVVYGFIIAVTEVAKAITSLVERKSNWSVNKKRN